MTDHKLSSVLITGGTGMLGVALQMSAPEGVQGFATCTVSRSLSMPLPFEMIKADLLDQIGMNYAFDRAKPDLVIHTAGIGSVDFAENNKEISRRVNLDGSLLVLDLCRKYNSRIIYISTNAVFDGRSPLYNESSPVNPINYYGMTKVEVEHAVQNSSLRWAIVRPILMYGWPYPQGRDNPVVRWLRSLESGKPIQVVDNVFSKPFPAASCAEIIWTIATQDRPGIYHAAGRDHLSLYQFAMQTAEVFGLNTSLIDPVPDSFFPEIAPRPRDTSFDTTKIETELGIQPVSIFEGLTRMKDERISL